MLALLAVALLVVPDAADARKRRPRLYHWYRYTVQFTCGPWSGAPGPVLAGDHTTAVHVLNKSPSPAGLKGRIHLTTPPGGPLPGYVSEQARTSLDGLAAAQVDCSMLAAAALLAPDLPTLPAFVQGFVTLESSVPLEVKVVHGTAASGGAVSVEHATVPAEWITSYWPF